jgi:S-(hydroxymethyl)glutathione dehydrogenase/alcohol dehydrogenase
VRQCRYCVTGRPHLCDVGASDHRPARQRTRDAKGAPLNIFSACGVMAEYASLHVDNVVKIAPGMPLPQAALISCGVMTGVGAVFNTAKVEPGASVLVIGAGGIGLNVIQGCAIAGAGLIVAVDMTDNKLELARVRRHAYDQCRQGREPGQGGEKAQRRRGGPPSSASGWGRWKAPCAKAAPRWWWAWRAAATTPR